MYYLISECNCPCQCIYIMPKPLSWSTFLYSVNEQFCGENIKKFKRANKVYGAGSASEERYFRTLGSPSLRSGSACSGMEAGRVPILLAWFLPPSWLDHLSSHFA